MNSFQHTLSSKDFFYSGLDRTEGEPTAHFLEMRSIVFLTNALTFND